MLLKTFDVTLKELEHLGDNPSFAEISELFHNLWIEPNSERYNYVRIGSIDVEHLSNGQIEVRFRTRFSV